MCHQAKGETGPPDLLSPPLLKHSRNFNQLHRLSPSLSRLLLKFPSCCTPSLLRQGLRLIKMAKWRGFVVGLLMLHAHLQICSADWTLVVTHSNDLWYQLDEIKGDDTPCYVDLPPTTPATTTTTTTPATTTTTTTPATTTTTTTPATTTTTPATTTTTTTPATTTTPVTTTTTPATPTTATPATTITPTTTPATTTTPPSTLPTSESSSTKLSPPPPSDSPAYFLRKRRSLDNTKGSESLEFREVVPDVEENVKALELLNVPEKPSQNSISGNAKAPLSSCYGGVSRHLKVTNEVRKVSEDNNKIFLNLNAGGMLGGIIWYQILGSGPAAESIKMLNFSAVGLGYRDFEEGISGAVEYLKELKNLGVTVLCANMDISAEPSMKGLFEKSMVLDLNGKKIGIVGYIGQDADFMADTGKIIFTDPKTAIEKEIGVLQTSGAQFIIALGSAGYNGALDILNNAFNVDLVVNGGSNTFLYNGVSPLNENIKGPYPTVVNSQSTQRVLVQTTRYGKYLGKIELKIHDEGRILSYSTTNPILLDNSVGQDEVLQGKVDEWERQVLIVSNETIGYTKIPIISEKQYCWFAECTGASLMADAARWYLEKNMTEGNKWKGTVAATVWHGGALTDTDLDISEGFIKFGDILLMFPYANEIARVPMYGRQIKTLFENSVEYYNDPNEPNRGEFLHVSGMRVEYDITKPPQSRVVKIYIRDTNSNYGGMTEVEDDGWYQIGMPTFIANGGSRFSFMEDIPKNNTGVRDETILREYIQLFSPLTYGIEGRIKFVTSSPDEECPSTNVTGTVFLTIFLTLLFTGLIFVCYKFLYPKLRDRRGSLLSLVR